MRKINKRLRALAAVLSLALLALTGCTSSGFDNSNLLRPPKTTGDKAKIQSIIEHKAGGDYTLKYPQNGSYRSAIIYEDLDGDKTEEAIVFYKPSGDKETTHILLIKNFSGVWKDVGDYSSRSSEVDKVEIGDVTGDGANEVVVGWNNGSGNLCTLSVYVAGKKTTAELKAEDTFNQFLIADMTGEGKNSIMLFSVVDQNADANAKMLQYNSETNTLFTRSSVAMSNYANVYLNLSFGRATKEQAGVFADTINVNNESETQFIYWDKKKASLANPLNTQTGSVATNPSLRSSAENLCADINSDGLIEIPTMTLMPHNASENVNLVAFRTTWNRFDPEKGELSPILETVTDMQLGYYFVIPAEWRNRTTARGSRLGNAVTFYMWNEQDGGNENGGSADGSAPGGSLGDRLLTIQVFTAQEWTASQSKDYIEIGDYGESVYAVNIPAETKDTKGIAMSLNKMPDYFVMLNNK